MTLLAECQGLLEDVIQHPDEDGPRLVMADWFEDNGDSDRAEFIRVQVELARCSAVLWPDDWEERRAYIQGCEQELLDLRAADWFRADCGLPPRGAIDRNAWMYRSVGFSCWFGYVRGFLGRFDGPLQAWLDHGPSLVRRHPLERVNVSDRKPLDNGSWNRDDTLHNPSSFEYMGGWYLPRAIWDQLADYHQLSVGVDVLDGPNIKSYSGGKIKAMTELSSACLRWARNSSEGVKYG